MSIYIAGIEIPTGNPEEPTAVWLYPDGSVKAFYNCGNSIVDTYAIPVPPHGRLGDLDALYEKFLRLENEAMQALKTTNTGSVNWIKWSAILTERTGYKFDIADAPTIVPASE